MARAKRKSVLEMAQEVVAMGQVAVAMADEEVKRIEAASVHTPELQRISAAIDAAEDAGNEELAAALWAEMQGPSDALEAEWKHAHEAGRIARGGLQMAEDELLKAARAHMVKKVGALPRDVAGLYAGCIAGEAVYGAREKLVDLSLKLSPR